MKNKKHGFKFGRNAFRADYKAVRQPKSRK